MKKHILILATSAAFFGGCSKLDEKLKSELTYEEAKEVLTAGQLLQAAYNSMQGPYQSQDRLYCLQEHTTDAAIGPTRAGDWDDNGIWRVLHTQTWNADHAYITAVFNELLGVVFNATNVLNFNPSAQQKAEARYLRAFVMYTLLDLWNQVPYREPVEDLRQPSKVLVGNDALDFITTELKAIIPDLAESTPIYQANKNAARALLMRCYLNKGVIANRETPTFAAADMTEVVKLADEIIATNRYSLTASMFDNFTPNNDVTGKGIIFANQNFGGQLSGNVRSRWFAGLHYNQNPSGWNGFTTLSDFYDKYETADTRRYTEYPGMKEVGGLNVGYLVGQQYNQAGVALKDRKGNPLAFTREVKLRENGDNLEVTGIRVMKYVVDYSSGDNVNNDFVFIRFEDVLLMKAEAILRGAAATGSAPYNTPVNLVNAIRQRSKASTLATVTLETVYDERGREFAWESLRRSDMIRFQKYLLAFQEKPATTKERLLFPIPNGQLAVNPNLTQNPGY